MGGWIFRGEPASAFEPARGVQTADTYDGLTTDTPYDHVDVGAAGAAYAVVPGTGVYRRTFAKGIALVNPTTTP